MEQICSAHLRDIRQEYKFAIAEEFYMLLMHTKEEQDAHTGYG